MNKFWTFGLPLVLVTAYRLQPNSVRGFYQRHGCPVSTSHLAVAGLYRGEGWGAVFQAIADTKPPHPTLP